MKKVFFAITILFISRLNAQRSTIDFNSNWKFFLGNDSLAFQPNHDDKAWRTLTLPHDWSIELPFDEKAPATNQGGTLPGGIGWYRKTFTVPASTKGKNVSIEFDGVYRNSEVWINGHYLGKRPYGYVAFAYDLSEYLKFGEQNVIAVKVDNSQLPNSRWYSGSGIYRDVKLVTSSRTHIKSNDLFVSTPIVSKDSAVINVNAFVATEIAHYVMIKTSIKIFDTKHKLVASENGSAVLSNEAGVMNSKIVVHKPKLWSVESPELYTVEVKLLGGPNSKTFDSITTTFGIRSIKFDATKGFFLNDKHVPIKGVCMHHDLGALGAAFNRSAAERQLKILKEMGCNAIRTAHNPPAETFLDLCDSMGFLVMDEAFDMWKKKKNKYDYNIDFNEWYKKDLEAMVKRDRNHPSVIIWSIGNEIREQFDSTGTTLTKAMVDVVKSLDDTRPVTTALTENIPSKNFITQANQLDVLGWNYKELDYDSLPIRFPNMPLIAAETVSALESRGEYLLPADSMRVWPPDSKAKKTGNEQFTCNAYDNTYAYWGTTHEKSLLAIKKRPFMTGQFVWSGFDFIGEPVPYPWPARSSYYGIVDLAGFPKDVYYLYQSEWSSKPVLHLLPHWNWNAADTVDVWSYYSQADEVELYLNGKSLGKRQKSDSVLHVSWKVKFEPGTLRVVSRKAGKIVLQRAVQTAGKPYSIKLQVDKRIIHPDGKDLCFVTAQVVDKNGEVVPNADNLIEFSSNSLASIEATDNGLPTSLEPFKSNKHKAYNGLCLAIIKAGTQKGTVTVKAVSAGLKTGTATLSIQ